MNNKYRQRLTKLQSQIDDHTALVVSCPTDILYLSGFEHLVPEERESILAVSKNHVYLIHAAFSPVAKLSFIKNFAGVFPQRLSQHFAHICQVEGIKKLIIEADSLRVSEFNALKALDHIDLEPQASNYISEMRQIKDKHEISQIKTACQLSENVWQKLKTQIKTGVTELELADKITKLFLDLGVRTKAFPTIVAFGPHSALPHHQPTNTKLKANDAVLIDFGGTFENYRADMTRTIWHGQKEDPTFTEIKTHVASAYQAALDLIKQKIKTKKTFTAKELDSAARSIIANHGFGPEFIHTLGHGVGLDIHEQPSISWTNEQEIKPGMVITVEPGIYLPEKFGYRHENTVLVTNHGVEILS